MRELTAAEIERLASRPGVKRAAVENFLGTMDTALCWEGHWQNVCMDARRYDWNDKTLWALLEGIDLAAGMVRPKFTCASKKE